MLSCNKFLNLYKSTSAAWHLSLVLIFFPCTLLFYVDGMIKCLTLGQILVDSSLLALMLGILASVISLVICSTIYLLLKIKLNKCAQVLSVLSLIFAFTIGSYCFISLSRKWINNLVGAVEAPFPVKYKILSLLIVGIFAFLYRNEVSTRIREEYSSIIRASLALLIVSTVFVGARVIISGVTSTKYQVSTNTANNLSTNVILLSFDALSAEDMSLYGYQYDTTKNINRFAAQSYVFENMYSNGNWTRPGVASILTGSLPSSHGLFSGSPFNIFPRNDRSHKNLPNYLKISGYTNAAIVSNLLFAHPFLNGTSKAFDYQPLNTISSSYMSSNWRSLQLMKMSPVFLRIDSTIIQWTMAIIDRYAPWLNRSLASFWGAKNWEENTPYPAELTFRLAKDYIEFAREPFFLWVHVLPPHEPYLSPNNFMHSLLPERILETKSSMELVYGKQFFRDKDKQAVDKLRLRYDESIKYADYCFEDFLNYLKQTGYYDKSIIVLTADHGESFEKGYLRHSGPYSYQQLIHIPLIIHLPKQIEGKRIKSNSEQADVAPTLIELLGLESPKGWFDGESLVPAMFGDYVSDRPKYSMNLENNRPENPDNIPQTRTIAVIRGRYKFIRYLDINKEELFDLSADPKENRDLSQKFPAVANELRSLIYRDVLSKLH